MITEYYITHFIDNILIFNHTKDTDDNDLYIDNEYAVWFGHPTRYDTNIDGIIENLIVHSYNNPILEDNAAESGSYMKTKYIGDVILAYDIYISFDLIFLNNSIKTYKILSDLTDNYYSSPIYYQVSHDWYDKDYRGILQISDFIEIYFIPQTNIIGVNFNLDEAVEYELDRLDEDIILDICKYLY